MNYVKYINGVTPNQVIDDKYYIAKNICAEIWDKPDKQVFEDVFHQTLMKCLVKFGKEKYDYDYLKAYFFKAFRINMIRHYLYSYNKMKSGIYVNDLIIPVTYNIDDHMDGFDMINYIRNSRGDEIANMLQDNLSGMTYKELAQKYHTTSIYYILSGIKDELKKIYLK